MNDILNPNIFTKKVDTHMQRVLSFINLKLKRNFNTMDEAFKYFDKSLNNGIISQEDFKDVLLNLVNNLYLNDAATVFRILDSNN